MAINIWDAISYAYSPLEANRFMNWRHTPDALQAITKIAYEIQDQQKLRPGECRYWTALWVKRVRSELSAPAIQVGGDLLAYNEYVYRCPEQGEFLDPSSVEFEQCWPGHSWLALGDLIGDISLIITAMDKTCQQTLKQVVENHFTEDGAIIRVPVSKAQDFQKQDLLYVPRGVYSDATINRHIEVGRLSDDEATK
jgi:hypothetical protein